MKLCFTRIKGDMVSIIKCIRAKLTPYSNTLFPIKNSIIATPDIIVYRIRLNSYILSIIYRIFEH